MKTLRRILLAVAAAALTCLMAGGCGVSKIKDIKLVSAGVKYIIPTSLRTFDAVLELGVDNIFNYVDRTMRPYHLGNNTSGTTVHVTFGIKFNYGKRVKNNIYSPYYHCICYYNSSYNGGNYSARSWLEHGRYF